MKYAKLMFFNAEMFSFFLFIMVTWCSCPLKAVSVAYGNLFSNQWSFTMLEAEVFKYNFFIAQKP